MALALGKFAEAINDYSINTDEISKSEDREDLLDDSSQKSQHNLETAMLKTMVFNTLIDNWLQHTRDSGLIEAILMTLSSLTPLLPKNSEEHSTVKLTPVLLNLCKKFLNVRLAVSRCSYHIFLNILMILHFRARLAIFGPSLVGQLEAQLPPPPPPRTSIEPPYSHSPFTR